MAEPRPLTVEDLVARNRRDLQWLRVRERDHAIEGERLKERQAYLERQRARLLAGWAHD